MNQVEKNQVGLLLRRLALGEKCGSDASGRDRQVCVSVRCEVCRNGALLAASREVKYL